MYYTISTLLTCVQHNEQKVDCVHTVFLLYYPNMIRKNPDTIFTMQVDSWLLSSFLLHGKFKDVIKTIINKYRNLLAGKFPLAVINSSDSVDKYYLCILPATLLLDNLIAVL